MSVRRKSAPLAQNKKFQKKKKKKGLEINKNTMNDSKQRSIRGMNTRLNLM